MITLASLHYTLIRKIIDNGFAPSLEELGDLLGASREEVVEGLYDLQEYHGVVLHPNEPKVWVIHPFSLAPTNFYVESEAGSWWGNCGWCSLGVAALVGGNVKITTTLGAEVKQIEINIVDGKIQEDGYYIHFPTPMKNAWDNVIYTCSNMLVFDGKEQIAEWSKKHNIPVGDIQPVEKIWEFSKKWYGNHLKPNWQKWTAEEAKEMFKEFGLVNDTWNLDATKERF